MKNFKNKRLLIILSLILCLILLLWNIINYSNSGLISFFVIIISVLTFKLHKKIMIPIIILIFHISIILIPIDFTFKNYPGPPKLIPVIYGKPTREMGLKAEKGELYLKGCIGDFYPLKYVIVW